MEALIAVVVVGLLAVYTYFNKKTDTSKYVERDAKLAGKQEVKEEDLSDIEDKIKRVEEKLGRMKKPEDIENHWNKKK